MRILVVVDMQNDFITGALGTGEAQGIVEAVRRKVASFDGEVIFTLDTHTEDYLSSQEGRMLPVVHCVKDTWGWKLDEGLEDFASAHGCLRFEKPTFGSIALAHHLAARKEEIESVELVGLCTDICVVSNALILKAVLSETPIIVDSSCCAGVTRERHQAALETMASCQVIVR